MTIVQKVIKLLDTNKQMNLQGIYKSLKEHTPASIRGNINRYISNTKNPKIKRIEKGLYSIIEVLSVEKINDTQSKISYVNECKYNNKRVAFFHKDYIVDEDIEIGTFKREVSYDNYSKMMNDYNSLYSTIVQGDCREVLKKLKDNSFDCMITDPAYACISGGTSGKKGTPSGILAKNDGKIFENNNIKFSEWLGETYRVLKEGSHAYIFTNFLNLQSLMEEAQKVGYKLHNLLVWEKNTCTPNRWYMKNAEYVLLCRKGKAKPINNKGSKTVQLVDNIVGNKIHETEKPFELIEEYLLNSTTEGQWILEPFGGSMVLNVVGLKHNRKVFSVDMDNKYITNGINRVRNYLKSGIDRLITE